MSESTVNSQPMAFSAFVRQMLDEMPKRCKVELRMSQDCFIDVRDELTKRNLLRDRPEFTVNKQLALFLYSLWHKDGIQLAQDLFGIACEVFDQYFFRGTTTIRTIGRDYIKLRDPSDKPVFKYDRRFYT